MEHREHVADLGFEVDFGIGEVKTLTLAGIARREQFMPGSPQEGTHLAPAEAGGPGTMRHEENRQRARSAYSKAAFIAAISKFC